MIDKLTKAQEDLIPKYREEYRAIGLSTGPTDKVKAEAAITELYTYMKQPQPKFIWHPSPYKGLVEATTLAAGTPDFTADQMTEQLDAANFASFDAYWVALYAYIADNLPIQHDGLIEIVKKVTKNCGVCWLFETVAVMTEKPIYIGMKDERLHNENGLALEYADGTGVVAVNGTQYDSLLEAAVAVAATK